jgi:predicted nucleotidyltransferase
VDAVILIGLDEIPGLLRQASENGIQPRIEHAGAFARKNRVLLLRHVVSGIDIDISLGILPFEKEMVAHSRSLKLGGVELRLPIPEDLIILKAVGHGPQDMLDIESIITSQPALDKEYIRKWVQQFADAMEMTELLDDLSSLLK